MSAPAERRLIRLDGSELPPRAVVGGKAWSLAHMATRGLPVPPAVVITTAACRDYLRDGALPEGLIDEIRDGVAWLEQATGRRFGAGPRPLLMSVRSGAPVSMPGMMDTVLNLGIDDTTEAALAADCGDAAFARDTHRRFLELYARVVLKATPPALDPDGTPEQWRAAIDAAAGAVPRTPEALLLGAVGAVFDSWRSRRAQRYRRHHGIDDDLGTAVTLQAMVFGNMGADSGTGVLFSRNPLSGEPEPYGEYLACAQGEDVVSGSHTPQSLDALAASAPAVHAALLEAAETLEATAGDVQDIEFTVERGRLFLLQSRAAKRSAQAAVRTAVDLCHEGRIDTAEALRRVTPAQVHALLSPRLTANAADDAASLLHGEAASPGVGSGVVVTDSDEAERRAAA
ncbi:pyruvate, phosphate dikinase, partial [Algiphilus sp.]